MVGKITFLPSYKNGHRMTSRDIAREEVSIFTANAKICIYRIYSRIRVIVVIINVDEANIEKQNKTPSTGLFDVIILYRRTQPLLRYVSIRLFFPMFYLFNRPS